MLTETEIETGIIYKGGNEIRTKDKHQKQRNRK